MNTILTDVAIIGAGPAGYTAALYAARANLAPLMLAGAPSEEAPQRLPGGQLMTTTDVENYPGFEDPISGPELMRRMEAQAARAGARILQENALALELTTRPFRVRGERTTVESRAIVVATGAAARPLGVPGEETYRNRGVAFCATCDGALFADKNVVVVGGGDSALTEVLYLARLVRAVHVVHRRAELRASPLLRQRAARLPNVHFVYESTVQEVVGDGERMTGARVRHLRTGEESILSADGLFVSIGHTPATSLVRGQLDLDDAGYIRTRPGSTHTSLPGVFACGDVQDHIYRQAITAAGTGAMAAIDAERWLAEALR